MVESRDFSIRRTIHLFVFPPLKRRAFDNFKPTSYHLHISSSRTNYIRPHQIFAAKILRRLNFTKPTKLSHVPHNCHCANLTVKTDANSNISTDDQHKNCAKTLLTTKQLKIIAACRLPSIA